MNYSLGSGAILEVMKYIKTYCTGIALSEKSPENKDTFLAVADVTPEMLTISTEGNSYKLDISPNIAKVEKTGEAKKVSLFNYITGEILYTTTCPAVKLTAGKSITINAWSIEITNATSPQDN